MIEHAWSLLCTRSIIDPASNNLTLTEVLEQLNVQGEVQFPTIAPIQSDLVTVWYRRDPERGARGTGRMTIIGPDGNAVAPPNEFVIDLTRYFRGRSISRNTGMVLVGPGIYFIRVELRTAEGVWREVAKIPLNVVVEVTSAAHAAGPATAPSR